MQGDESFHVRLCTPQADQFGRAHRHHRERDILDLRAVCRNSQYEKLTATRFQANGFNYTYPEIFTRKMLFRGLCLFALFGSAAVPAEITASKFPRY